MVSYRLRHSRGERQGRMTSTQTWILIIAVCVIALVNLISLFRST